MGHMGPASLYICTLIILQEKYFCALGDYYQQRIPRGLTVRIAGFHPAGPGSTPGVGTSLFSENLRYLFLYVMFSALFRMEFAG
jgi:hypothetical protein